MSPEILDSLRNGMVIPACPLALNAARHLDERRQRALIRYYAAAGAGGLAVGVHTTQFAIREPSIGLFKPVLELAAEELRRGSEKMGRELVAVAGVCGRTEQAVSEAELVRELGYQSALLSLSAFKDATDDEMIRHCKAVAEILPVFGFYLQPSVGGRVLPYSFWRRFAEIENVVAVKIAPFNRYQTLDVVRAIAESGRADIAIYTGNDDNILMDLLTPFCFVVNGKPVEVRVVGGLLGHWAVWTKRAVEQFNECSAAAQAGEVPARLVARGVEVTDANAAFFDVAHGFAGCIAGIHEVLRRQGLFQGTWCLDPDECLSPGQLDEIDRVSAAYPHLNDDGFVSEHLDEWLRG